MRKINYLQLAGFALEAVKELRSSKINTVKFSESKQNHLDLFISRGNVANDLPRRCVHVPLLADPEKFVDAVLDTLLAEVTRAWAKTLQTPKEVIDNLLPLMDSFPLPEGFLVEYMTRPNRETGKSELIEVFYVDNGDGTKGRYMYSRTFHYRQVNANYESIAEQVHKELTGE